jgi:hypothetical protein
MNHLPSYRNNYIFIYFGMSLKMDDINVFFILIFIQIDINANINCICNYKPFSNHVCNSKSFLPNAIEDNCICSHKNGWFRHKLWMHGLEWIGFLVVWVSKWKCNLVNLKQWVDISFVLMSFLAKSNVIINNIIMINVNHATKAKQNFDATNEFISV